MIVLVYIWLRAKDSFVLPELRTLARRVISRSPRPYWRFGLANAFDKNISNQFVPLITQMVGAFGGSLAAGYFALAMRGVTQVTVLSVGILENLNSAIPQAIGRGDYFNLRRNFARIQGAVTVYSIFLFGAMALLAPLLVPLLFGQEWQPAIPAICILALYGVMTGIGGNFAPLYRSFGQMRLAVATKIVALAVGLPIAFMLIRAAANGVLLNTSLLASFTRVAPELTAGISASSIAAAAGAVSLNILFATSIGLTAIFTLRELNKRASLDHT